jgi:putative transposase
VNAIAATLPGASWQQCRTHYVANLTSATPKSSWGWVKAPQHSAYDQPDAESVHAQFDRVIDALTEKLPTVADHLEPGAHDSCRVGLQTDRCTDRLGRSQPWLGLPTVDRAGSG